VVGTGGSGQQTW